MTDLITFSEDDLKQIQAFMGLNMKQPLSKGEFELLISRSKRLGIDPRDKTIYAIRRGDAISIEIGIDGLCQIAARTDSYAGIAVPVWDFGNSTPNPNGTTIPVSATATVYRIVQGKKCAFTATVFWAELHGDLSRASSFWVKMPAHMLYKVALSQALRKAFPAELAGTYTREEMSQAGFVDDGYDDTEVPVPAYNRPAEPAPQAPTQANAQPAAPAAPQPAAAQPTPKAAVQPAPQPAPQPAARPATFAAKADLGMQPATLTQQKVISGLIMNPPAGIDAKTFFTWVRTTHFAEVEAGPRSKDFVEALTQDQAKKFIDNWTAWQRFYLAQHKAAETQVEAPTGSTEEPTPLTPEEAALYRPADADSPTCKDVLDFQQLGDQVVQLIMNYSDVEPAGDGEYRLVTPTGTTNEPPVAQKRVVEMLREIHAWGANQKFPNVASATEMGIALDHLDAMRAAFLDASHGEEGAKLRTIMDNIRVPQRTLPQPLVA